MLPRNELKRVREEYISKYMPGAPAEDDGSVER
jgi:vacuolar-type H+-ATPase subunit B/Vma2